MLQKKDKCLIRVGASGSSRGSSSFAAPAVAQQHQELPFIQRSASFLLLPVRSSSSSSISSSSSSSSTGCFDTIKSWFYGRLGGKALLVRLAAAACCCLLLSCLFTAAAAGGGSRHSSRADGGHNRRGGRGRGSAAVSPPASSRASGSAAPGPETVDGNRPSRAAAAAAAAASGTSGAARYLRQPSYKLLARVGAESGEASDVSNSSSSRNSSSNTSSSRLSGQLAAAAAVAAAGGGSRREDEQSVSEDTWSSMPETHDEDVLTEAENMCPPSQFLHPVEPSHSLNDPADLFEAFGYFAEQRRNRESPKLLLFLNAGEGEELIVNRQISQRLVMRPTVRKKRSGFFSPSEGVAELSDEGRVQAEIKHSLLHKFVSLLRGSSASKKKQACVDAFLLSPLQSGVETALETLAGLLEQLSCSVPEPAAGAAHMHTDNNYTRSNVRLLIAPQLREVIEAEGDVGESLPSVLKKTKPLRVNRGFQRDIFDCAVANYGARWRRQQLGAAGGSPSPMEETLGLLHAPAADPGEAQHPAAVAALLQLLDRFSDAAQSAQSGRRALGLRTTFAFLKETANQEAATQRAVWAAPEELEPDACESEASITRRGMSLLRALCAIKETHKYFLVSHPKLVERITGMPVDNGELVGFILDCQGLASCLTSAGVRPWESAAPAATPAAAPAAPAAASNIKAK
ncbi:hypothetical protein Emag_000095 [Eimeria magna]